MTLTERYRAMMEGPPNTYQVVYICHNMGGFSRCKDVIFEVGGSNAADAFEKAKKLYDLPPKCRHGEMVRMAVILVI